MSVLCQTLNNYEVICSLLSRILQINEYMQKQLYYNKDNLIRTGTEA